MFPTTRSARWAWIVALTATLGLVLVIAFVVRMGLGEWGPGERSLVALFWANVAVAAALTVAIVFAGVRMVTRLRRGKFGSRLLIKLAGIFAIVGVLPGLTIYLVSSQFVNQTLAAWFDTRLAGALDAGLALGKGALDTLAVDLAAKARQGAERVSDAERAEALGPLVVERVREQLGVPEMALVSGTGQVLLTAGGTPPRALLPESPGPALLRQARTNGVASAIEGLDDEALAAGGSGARVRALARLPAREWSIARGGDRFLLLTQPLSRAFAQNALAVQAAYAEYQQRALARESLRRLYLGTLTLALILAVFAAVLLAILLGTQLAKPLLLLADGVRQVAAGDLTQRPVFASGDELGGLTRSFADMTAQLADARQQVQGGVAQLEAARTRLQTILDTLTAGVIVLDGEGRIDAVNPGATRILRVPFAAYHGRRLVELAGLETLTRSIEQRFELLQRSPEVGERDHWQESYEFTRGDGTSISLLVRGANLPDGTRLVVFDDISDVVSAQRSAAWAEVARRLAHEIKNPLTPIQLSAERLQHRLEAKLEGNDQALLGRSVHTIVSQVQAMQKLVNEFRDYARLPAAQPRPLDLNALVQEVLALYGQAHDAGTLRARIEPGLPIILGDATQLRQVIHNLVQNALDAVAERADGCVEVVTSLARGEHGDVRAARLAVIDNGPGFSENVLKRAFEPYVTTKTKGTGLGLAVVKKIADEHHARISVVNLRRGDHPDAEVIGARVSLSFSNFAPATSEAVH